MTVTVPLRLDHRHRHSPADHPWMHFTRMGSYDEQHPVPVIERGEGCLHLGHQRQAVPGRAVRAVRGAGRARPGGTRRRPPPRRPASSRSSRSGPTRTPPAIELADRIAAAAPGDLNKVFFSSGGGESVETAWKLAKQYYKLTGKPEQDTR